MSLVEACWQLYDGAMNIAKTWPPGSPARAVWKLEADRWLTRWFDAAEHELTRQSTRA